MNYFKVGYYYKFIGNINECTWYDIEKMILNSDWHKCIFTSSKIKDYAQLEGMYAGLRLNKKNWIKSKYLPRDKVKKLLKET